jgi:hypothetical protein
VSPGLIAGGWPTDVPVELGRDEARRLAIRELANPVYDAEPPLPQRVVEWIIERIQELIGRTAGALDGGFGVAILATVVALVVAVIVMRMGPLARRQRLRSEPLFPAARRTAAEYRAAADAAAVAENWSAAVVERYRAIIVGFEERGVLDPRPGRTADEAAAEAGVAFPGLAGELIDASRLFDVVRYGDQEAARADDERMRRLDDNTRAARPAPGGLTTDVLSPAAPR